MTVGFLGRDTKRRRYARMLDRARVIQKHCPQIPWHEALVLSRQMDRWWLKAQAEEKDVSPPR